MRAPVLAAGDGALGFWGALREVFPQTREQRCWFHKTANVLAALPKSAHQREEGPRGDLERRSQAARPRRGESVRGRLRAKFPKAARWVVVAGSYLARAVGARTDPHDEHGSGEKIPDYELTELHR